MPLVLRTFAALATVGILVAQDPTPRDPSAPPPQADEVRALIDRFHSVMPRDPASLRQASVRRSVAPAALPVLRSIREFLKDHADCGLAPRGLEFTIYAAVLDDETVRAPLQKQVVADDAAAKLLLDCAAAIQASDGARRAAAIDAVASGLARKPAGAAVDGATTSSVVQCLLMAGDLCEAEAELLAKRTADKDLAARFESAARSAARDPRLLLGKPLELTGKLVDGTPFGTASLLGKVVLVDFWATWCQPCVRSLPDLVAAQRKYRSQGLAIVGVSSDREAEALTTFLRAHPEVDWPQMYETPHQEAPQQEKPQQETPQQETAQNGWHPLASKLGITAIPRLFVIDKKGVLRSVDAKDKLDELLVRLLAQ